MLTTSTAEVLLPSVNDFIFALFYYALNLPKLLARQAVILRQFDARLQPKLRFPVGGVDVDVPSALLFGKEEKAKAFMSEDGRTHSLYSICELA